MQRRCVHDELVNNTNSSKRSCASTSSEDVVFLDLLLVSNHGSNNDGGLLTNNKTRNSKKTLWSWSNHETSFSSSAPQRQQQRAFGRHRLCEFRIEAQSSTRGGDCNNDAAVDKQSRCRGWMKKNGPLNTQSNHETSCSSGFFATRTLHHWPHRRRSLVSSPEMDETTTGSEQRPVSLQRRNSNYQDFVYLPPTSTTMATAVEENKQQQQQQRPSLSRSQSWCREISSQSLRTQDLTASSLEEEDDDDSSHANADDFALSVWAGTTTSKRLPLQSQPSSSWASLSFSSSSMDDNDYCTSQRQQQQQLPYLASSNHSALGKQERDDDDDDDNCSCTTASDGSSQDEQVGIDIQWQPNKMSRPRKQQERKNNKRCERVKDDKAFEPLTPYWLLSSREQSRRSSLSLLERQRPQQQQRRHTQLQHS